jgi:hypothetical protein
VESGEWRLERLNHERKRGKNQLFSYLNIITHSLAAARERRASHADNREEKHGVLHDELWLPIEIQSLFSCTSRHLAGLAGSWKTSVQCQHCTASRACERREVSHDNRPEAPCHDWAICGALRFGGAA